MPLSERAKEILTKKFGSSEFYIGLDPAILLGDAQVVTTGLIFIPLTLLIAIIVPGNRVLPFGDLATISFFIAIAVAVHKGNIFRTLLSGSAIMYMTIWIANQTIPWMTALAKTTGTTDGKNLVAALDQGGSPITYMYTEIFTKENVIGAVVIAVIYVICLLFTINHSKKRAEALKAAEEII
ncbi:MAG: PTS EIIC type-2 domain-containing protein [Clostridium sp.]